jgi:DNA-binding NarL/FixJ family response regulator
MDLGFDSSWATNTARSRSLGPSASGALAEGSSESKLDSVTLGAMWRALVSGAARVVDSFATSERHGLVLATDAERPGTALPERQLAVLEAVLLATQQKSVGIDLARSPSSVACSLKKTLSRMGVCDIPSRIPLLFVVAAHAARTTDVSCSVRVSEQRAGTAVYRTFTLHDPSAWLAARLSVGRARVARLRIEGKSYEQIATHCQISVRTVANHLATIHRTLEVSGRLGLLARLAQEYVRGNVPTLGVTTEPR